MGVTSCRFKSDLRHSWFPIGWRNPRPPRGATGAIYQSARTRGELLGCRSAHYCNTLTGVRFTWDPNKALANERKHGISFEEATTIFADPLALIVEDVLHADRSLVIGESIVHRVLVAVFVAIAMGEIRIVSARRATRHERKNYEEGKK